MKSNRKILLNFALLLCSVQLSSSEILITEDGIIDGRIMGARSGQEFHAFRGIPYAEPPIGPLRFAPPVRKAAWVGVLETKEYGAMCMQEDRFGGNIPIDEDCLFLNVFTRNLPSNQNIQLLPVIVFIHGGGFELGSGNEYGPEYLMDREIVLVTINYRLAAFGLMALDTQEVPGNAAMKDQSLALQWVKRNIHSFGGDPDRVTLSGLSAGAHSATAHMISPMSQDLFQGVIAVSGALPWQRTLKADNLEAARALAELIDCPTENVTTMLTCFRSKPATEIASNMALPFFACPIMNWQPVVEPDFGQERFLTDEPNVLFSNGNFSRVPVIVGITADEFISPIADILGNATLTANLNENFNTLGPRCFNYEGNQYKSTDEVSKIIRDYYVPFDKIDIRSFNTLSNLIGDGIIGYGVHRFVHYVSRYSDVYYYKFSFIGRFSRFYHPRDKPYGVHHVDDIQYIFNSFFIGPMIQTYEPENIAVERMTRIWEQFAHTGDPHNTTDLYLREMVWPKHSNETEYYLDIGTHLVEKHGLFLNRYAMWDALETSSGFMLKANFLVIIALLKFLF